MGLLDEQPLCVVCEKICFMRIKPCFIVLVALVESEVSGKRAVQKSVMELFALSAEEAGLL